MIDRWFTLGIDPGHGGFDRGCEHNDIIESQYVWELAHKLPYSLMHWPVQIVYTRLDDEMLNLKQRAEIINRADCDLFISLHCDANSNPKNQGNLIFFKHGDDIAQKVGYILGQATPIEFRRRNYLYKASSNGWTSRAYNTIQRIKCPAITYEIGRITNRNDAQAMKLESVQFGIVSAIMCAIARGMELKEGMK